ncbi:MAG: DMT family transporter [Clostridia bacterium]|nr:DMT family transporter [Clostridia bacterium]
MNNLISAAIGFIIALMVLANGVLAGYTGLYLSTAIIHAVGLVSIGAVLIIGKHKIKNLKTVPYILYAGGLLGVSNVLLNNFCFPALGVSLTLTLGQAGQFLASAVIDHYGLFGLKKVPFNKKKVLGLIIVGAGLIVMMFE